MGPADASDLSPSICLIALAFKGHHHIATRPGLALPVGKAVAIVPFAWPVQGAPTAFARPSRSPLRGLIFTGFYRSLDYCYGLRFDRLTGLV